MSKQLIQATRQLAEKCGELPFISPAAYVYCPLQYAWQAHEQYLRRYGKGPKQALFVGMNPGPWGMGQTGVPFGDVVSVKDWMGISVDIKQPPQDKIHPKRPLQGLDCPRREVSGKRLWTLFADRYGNAKQFFSRYFVLNYCPLLFLKEGGGNLTPKKLSSANAESTKQMYGYCDEFLQTAVKLLRPTMLIGVGEFAEKRLNKAFKGQGIIIGKILHPSPASGRANVGGGRGFSETAAKQLGSYGL